MSKLQVSPLTVRYASLAPLTRLWAQLLSVVAH